MSQKRNMQLWNYVTKVSMAHILLLISGTYFWNFCDFPAQSIAARTTARVLEENKIIEVVRDSLDPMFMGL